MLAGLIVVVGAIVFMAVLARYFNLWIQCIFTRADINIWQLMMMSIRKVNPTVIVRSKIMAVQAGLTRAYPITTRALEAHYLAGGNVPNVIRASSPPIAPTSISTGRRPRRSTWRAATCSKRFAPAFIRKSSIAPIPSDRPAPSMRSPVTEFGSKRGACDGPHESSASWSAAPRKRPLFARVGQGIVQAIGSTRSYKIVLENPERISETVLGQGLEAHTAYEIVSIDIADIDVGRKHRHPVDGRSSRGRHARCSGEGRATSSRRQSSRAGRDRPHSGKSGQGCRGRSPSPTRRLPSRFRTGKLGLLDYYELKNVQADTR